VPGVAVGAVILSHGAPGAGCEIRTNELPVVLRASRRLREPCMLSGADCFLLLPATHSERILISVFIVDARGAESSPRPAPQAGASPERPPTGAFAYLPVGFSKWPPIRKRVFESACSVVRVAAPKKAQ